MKTKIPLKASIWCMCLFVFGLSLGQINEIPAYYDTHQTISVFDNDNDIFKMSLINTEFMNSMKKANRTGRLCTEKTQDSFLKKCALLDDHLLFQLNWIWLTDDLVDLKKTLTFAANNKIFALLLVSSEDLEDELEEYKQNKDYGFIDYVLRIKPDDAYKLQTYGISNHLDYYTKIQYDKYHDCDLITSPLYYFIAIIAINAVFCVYYLFCINKFYKENVDIIHKVLAALVIIKVIDDILYTIIIGICSIYDTYENPVLYIHITNIISSTIYQTIMIAIIICLSRGFGVTKNNLTKNQITIISMLMAGVYLNNTILYVAEDMTAIRIPVRVVIICIYLGLIYSAHSHTLINIRCIKLLSSVIDLEEIRQVLKIKNRMLWVNIILIDLYCGFHAIGNLFTAFTHVPETWLVVITTLIATSNLISSIGFAINQHPCFYQMYFASIDVLEGLVARGQRDDGADDPIFIKKAIIDLNKTKDPLYNFKTDLPDEFENNLSIFILNPLQYSNLQKQEHQLQQCVVIDSIDLAKTCQPQEDSKKD